MAVTHRSHLTLAGTCEELISWDEVGGVQRSARKHIRSTQGHNFRVRDAHSGRMLMQHTLNDLVIRSCDQEGEKGKDSEMTSLQLEIKTLEDEHEALRAQLFGELSRLIADIGAAMPNSTANASHAASFSVSEHGAISPALLLLSAK